MNINPVSTPSSNHPFLEESQSEDRPSASVPLPLPQPQSNSGDIANTRGKIADSSSPEEEKKRVENIALSIFSNTLESQYENVHSLFPTYVYIEELNKCICLDFVTYFEASVNRTEEKQKKQFDPSCNNYIEDFVAYELHSAHPKKPVLEKSLDDLQFTRAFNPIGDGQCGAYCIAEGLKGYSKEMQRLVQAAESWFSFVKKKISSKLYGKVHSIFEEGKAGLEEIGKGTSLVEMDNKIIRAIGFVFRNVVFSLLNQAHQSELEKQKAGLKSIFEELSNCFTAKDHEITQTKFAQSYKDLISKNEFLKEECFLDNGLHQDWIYHAMCHLQLHSHFAFYKVTREKTVQLLKGDPSAPFGIVLNGFHFYLFEKSQKPQNQSCLVM